MKDLPLVVTAADDALVDFRLSEARDPEGKGKAKETRP